LPQVAFTPVIPPQQPEPPARAAASNEPSGTFGDILDASAGSAAPRADSPNRARTADGADQAKPTDDGSAPSTDASDKHSGTAQAKPAGAPAANEQSDTASAESVATDAVTAVTPLELALLAQIIPADAATAVSPNLPTGKPRETEKAAAKADAASSDKTIDGSEDAKPPANTPEGTTTITAPAIVAVAAAVPIPPVPATNTVGAVGIPSIAAQGFASVSIDSAPGKASQLTAVDSSTPAAQDDALSAHIDGAPVKTQAQVAAGTPVSTPPSPEGVAASADAGSSIKDAVTSSASADIAPFQAAAATDKPVKPTEKKSAGLPQAETKSLSREDDGLKTEASAADGKKPQTSKAQGAPHEDAKLAQAKTSSDEAHAAADAGEQDAKPPAAHQAPAQPSEHASATARAAFAAAHSDISAPPSVAQAVTAQLGNNAPAAELNLAVPLTSPLQSVWQAAPQRGDASDNAVPVAGLAVEIVSRAQDGLRRFEIRLDPPELGRIDVRLDVDRSGNVTSRLTVERADTLDLLRRDAPQLERALQHAGLNTEGGGLQFSLRDQNFANREQSHQNAPTLILTDDEPAAAEAARRGYGRLIGLGGGIDIRV
jgi:flagellar hook-length control protein FliK